ncbi:hypothetical protein GCM10027589_25050 [Actinocorallia lasiicapitis]
MGIRNRVTAAACGLAVLAATTVAALPARADTSSTYYLALGDSLSLGSQHGHSTDEGYTDALYAGFKATQPELKLVKLGCGGESTTTMIEGGICPYPEGSQLNAAVAFLKAHPGRVKYVTLDIGVNFGCTLRLEDALCWLLKGAAPLATNLPRIGRALKEAGGDTPRYAAMNYFDPELSRWVRGDKLTAVASVPMLDAFNFLGSTAAASFGVPVADVNGAFSTHDFVTQVTVEPYGRIPLNVARICAWTYACSDNDGHATTEGYRQIANAFRKVLQ